MTTVGQLLRKEIVPKAMESVAYKTIICDYIGISRTPTLLISASPFFSKHHLNAYHGRESWNYLNSIFLNGVPNFQTSGSINCISDKIKLPMKPKRTTDEYCQKPISLWSQWFAYVKMFSALRDKTGGGFSVGWKSCKPLTITCRKWATLTFYNLAPEAPLMPAAALPAMPDVTDPASLINSVALSDATNWIIFAIRLLNVPWLIHHVIQAKMP